MVRHGPHPDESVTLVYLSMVRAVFMGSDSFSVPILEALLAHGPGLPVPVQTVGVVTAPERPAGRGRKPMAGPVRLVAERAELAVLQPERLREPAAQETVLTLRPDLIVVASYGQILPRRLLEAPKYLSLNLHPSLLPHFRGPSPVVSAILTGERTTGSSLMVMTATMDAGPILAQRETAIGPGETGGELRVRLANLSAELLLAYLPDWVRGTLTPQPQREDEATYTRRITKEDGMIDWRDSAAAIVSRVRAFNPWPTAYTIWQEQQLRLLRATARPGRGEPGQVLGLDGADLLVGTGDGLLAVEQLHLAGGRPLAPADFLRGHPALGSARFVREASWSSA